MKYSEAASISAWIIAHLQPHCSRISVAGSLRRQRDEVGDIDIVAIPLSDSEINAELDKLNVEWIIKSGKLKRFRYNASGIGVVANIDIYFTDADGWIPLLMVRTGSKEFNIKLASRAKSLGMKLSMGEQGLTLKDGSRLKCVEEQDIFRALGLPYVEPRKREVIES